jgi:hypothetical protein
MDEENKDLSTSRDTQVNENDDQHSNDTEDRGDDELALLKAENEKLKKAKSDQEQRAKIAEDKLKKATPAQTQSQPKKDDLTMLEAMTLMKSGVHEEDIESVKRFAKLENISIADALKNDELKAVLHVREEKRKTAEATSTGKSPRGSTQVSDEVLLERANKGQIPEAGSKEADALFWARHGGRR